MKKLFAVGGMIGLSLMFVVPKAKASGAYLLLSSYSGQPGSMTEVSGAGFASLDSVSIFVGTNTSPAAVTQASTAGDIAPIAIMISGNVPPAASIDITAKGSSGLEASIPFFVNGYYPTLTIASTGNTPGSTVTATGSGFAPSENISLTMGDFVAQNLSSDSSGNLAAVSFQIPEIAAGSYTINAQGAVSQTPATAYFYVGGFYPNVFPSAFYLIPGQTINFSGGGFEPGESVQVLAGSSVVAEFATDNTGAYKNAGTYTIPVTTPSGPMSFVLKGSSSGASVSADITIGKFNPQVFPSSYFLLPGNIVSFSGINFAPYEAIRIYEGENPVSLNTVMADAQGNFPVDSLGFAIPASFASTKRTIKIVGDVSQQPVTLTLAIGSYTPQLAPSSYYIKPGQDITVDGWDFLPKETVDVWLSNIAQSSLTANSTGNIKIGPVTVPFHLPTLSFKTYGEQSGGTASLDIPISNLFPTVTASSYYVTPGASVSFSGGAFAAEEVEVSEEDAGGNTLQLGTIHTNPDGYLLDNSFPIGLNTPAGDDVFTFKGQSSGAENSVTISIANFIPLLSSDNYYPMPGSTIHIWASGFGPLENLDVSVDGQIVTQAMADQVGSAGPIAVTLPLRETSTVISVLGEASAATQSMTLGLSTFSPVVSASTYYTLPGTQISFSGWGFAPNENVSISSPDGSIATVVTDSDGKFTSDKFTIPFGAKNSISYTIVGDQSVQSNTITVSLGSYTPYLLLSLYYGNAGASLTVSGADFAPGETVSVSFGGQDLGTATTDTTGQFALDTAVPAGSGSVSVSASGASSGGVASTTFTFAN
ncbi:MAG TPA: hypothetical protein VFX17_03585 [Patescibacteria group bacterium]|nr:hypothetical protein [Patescibacteria group bacterium]